MPGQSWSDQLNDAIKTARVMLALVGSGWDVRGEDEGEDWVRSELLGAIKAGVPVLPVLIGDPDVLAQRLTKLPEVFTKQAVKVNEELAGFDLHQIEKGLRDLGAFEGDRREGFGEQRADLVPAAGVERALQALQNGQSVLVSGASGSGRAALLRRMVEKAQAGPGLVAAYGINRSARNRRTHRVVASWLDGLCMAIRERPTESERAKYGQHLVSAVIDRGPDLLGRQVLRPARLLPLGNDQSDRAILEAARRPIDRWAPFPPERLVSQSLGVVQQFANLADRPITLIVDNIDSIDGSSADLVRQLAKSPAKNLRLILATTSAGSDGGIVGLDPTELDHFTVISLSDPEIWGEPGSIIENWLERHDVRLGAGLRERFLDPNPYYALSALWYLVDNGYIVEDTSSSSEDHVTWVPADSGEALIVPSRDRLLDHMVEEFLPIRFRDLIAAGSLMGRTFPFSAAFAAAHPPESTDGEEPSARSIDRWRKAANQMWAQLSAVDPDGAVIECHMSFDKERKVTLAQMDLVAHFAQGLDSATTQPLHERLAQYFTDPIAEDIGRSLDDRYGRAEAGAKHWASANRPREAADAERIAAQLAEQGLAYREARAHYQAAIRLLTQLLAENAHNETVSHVEHEDLLILANCLYRLGQMTRLANERGSTEGSTDATVYFLHALVRLRELSAILHDKRLAAPLSPGHASSSPRDIPEPNITRHHIRLTEALSGYINLELAEWHEVRENSARSRELLFETLRHAEAARGEAGSRWLLAAASARLAQQLANDAAKARHIEPVRAHNLAVEALFHIERVIGLRAVSPDEDRDLDDPRSRAWTVLGQIFENLDNEPRLAEWAFRRMNEHRRDVSDVVDMMTDRQLGMFLLSVCPGTPDDGAGALSVIGEARVLLEGYARWAFESGIDQEQSGAYLSLALLALVERTAGSSPDLALAHEQVEKAIDLASDDRQRQAAHLLQGVLHALGNSSPDGVALDAGPVEVAFRAAGLDTPASATADDVLRAGWRTSLMRMLAVSPQMKELARPVAKRLFGDELEDGSSELADALTRADQYVERLASDRRLVPSSDRAIWKLLEGRVPKETLDHAKNTRAAARRLLETHRIELEATEEFTFDQQLRDVDYAVAVHDWYRSTDPARLLTLARESNASITGSEWASPNLLRGRLAIQLVKRQYGAEIEIGRQRFGCIESMVTNRTIGSKDTGLLEQVFFLASQMAEPDLAVRVVSAGKRSRDWRRVALEPGGLGEAYQLAVAEREALVRQAGLPLVQDLHLLDVAAAPISAVFEELEAVAQTIDLTEPADVTTPS